MDFDQYWESLKKKNPGFADDDTTMKISVKSLRDTLRQAFEAGGESSTVLNAIDKAFNAGKESNYRNGSAFDRIFGGGMFK